MKCNIKRIAVAIFVCVFCAWLVIGALAENITCWVLCKPGNFVNVRETPSKRGRITGRLDCGDSFETDAECKNGFIQAIGIGEAGDGWVYAGFVITDKPEPIFNNYYCVANKRVACRRWIGGPLIRGKTGWLYNGTIVQVFYRSEEWCITSRGYIKSEWLEPYPD